MNKTILFLVLCFFIGCSQLDSKDQPDVYVMVLGIAQDAGYPQIGCNRACCQPVWQGKEKPEKVVSLGLVDKVNDKVWLFDATPDFKEQYQLLMAQLDNPDSNNLGGIFLTHAHIGHYTGLMHLGREAMGAKSVSVYAMPRMQKFLESNGPWSQLVNLQNIIIKPLQADSVIRIAENISVTPLLVPHRDEYSETVGYRVVTDQKAFLFIPDIDKWQKWGRKIAEEIKLVDYAFLDGSFYSADELPNRDMSEIPHPYVPETMALLNRESNEIKQKVVFIHFNHTNALIHDGDASRDVHAAGYQLAREGMIFHLN